MDPPKVEKRNPGSCIKPLPSGRRWWKKPGADLHNLDEHARQRAAYLQELKELQREAAGGEATSADRDRLAEIRKQQRLRYNFIKSADAEIAKSEAGVVRTQDGVTISPDGRPIQIAVAAQRFAGIKSSDPFMERADFFKRLYNEGAISEEELHQKLRELGGVKDKEKGGEEGEEGDKKLKGTEKLAKDTENLAKAAGHVNVGLGNLFNANTFVQLLFAVVLILLVWIVLRVFFPMVP